MAEASRRELNWLEDWIVLKLGVKAERARALLTGAGADAQPVVNFIEDASCERLVVLARDKDSLSCSSTVPSKLRRRAVLFTKLESVELTAQNIDAMVVPSDLMPDMLACAFSTCHEVFLPILSNHENQAGAPRRHPACVARAYGPPVSAPAPPPPSAT